MAVLLAFCLPGSAQEAPGSVTPQLPSPAFDNDPSNFTNSGSIKLTWSPGDVDADNSDIQFELQRATSSDFADARPCYHGPDRATYISGLADGDYYFRLREYISGGAHSEWSQPVEVKVEHHSLNLAFTLFGIGGLVFALTLIVVVRGAARTSDPDQSHATSGGEV